MAAIHNLENTYNRINLELDDLYTKVMCLFAPRSIQQIQWDTYFRVLRSDWPPNLRWPPPTILEIHKAVSGIWWDISGVYQSSHPGVHIENFQWICLSDRFGVSLTSESKFVALTRIPKWLITTLYCPYNKMASNLIICNVLDVH